jgi:hypothetical protein
VGGKAAVNALQGLSALLGEDVFFVGCEREAKKPLVTHVERAGERSLRAIYESGGIRGVNLRI